MLQAFNPKQNELDFIRSLSRHLLFPLQDVFSFVQYREDENKKDKRTCARLQIANQWIDLNSNNFQSLIQTVAQRETIILDCRKLTLECYTELLNIFNCFARQPNYEVPFKRRIHQGWHEDKQAYIYQNYWQTQQKFVHFTQVGNCQNKVVIIVDNTLILFLADHLHALQTEENIAVIWQQQGIFNIPPTQCMRTGAIETHINVNAMAFNADYCCQHLDLTNFDTDTLFMQKLPIQRTHEIKPHHSEIVVGNKHEYVAGFIKLYILVKLFYPYLDKEIWQQAWQVSLSQIESIQNLADYQRLLSTLLEKLNDGHAQIVFPELIKESPQPVKAKHFNLFSPAMAHIKVLENNIGYITPFTIPDSETLVQSFALLDNTRALIIDLRGYPRCHFKHALIEQLCTQQILSPRYEIPLISHQHDFEKQWKVIQYTVAGDANRCVYQQPIVALIDGSMQSAAEDVCMYLKYTGKVTFVGKKTAGCQGNACFVNLPFAGFASFTGMKVMHLDGQLATSIAPDIVVADDENILNSAITFLS